MEQAFRAAQSQPVVTYACWVKGLSPQKTRKIREVLTACVGNIFPYYYCHVLKEHLPTDFLKPYLDKRRLDTNDEMMKAVIALSKIDTLVFKNQGPGIPPPGLGAPLIDSMWIMRRLVDLGLRLDIRDSKGETFYHLLSRQSLTTYRGRFTAGMTFFVRLLLEKNVDPTQTNLSGHLPSRPDGSSGPFSSEFEEIERVWAAARKVAYAPATPSAP